MNNDEKKVGDRDDEKSSKGAKDGSGSVDAKLYFNQENGNTNFPVWSEMQILKIKSKLGAHVEDSILKGKWIPRKFVVDELFISFNGEEDEAQSEGGDTEGDGEGSNSSSSFSSGTSAGGSRRRSAATSSGRSQSISARAELEKMLKEKHYEEAIKVHAKKLSDDKDSCEKYCGELLLDISADSLALIQCQERYENVKNDLVKLFMLIREVHVTKKSKDPQLDKLRKENRLVALAQGQYESLAQYRKRFEREYVEAKEMGAEVGTEQSRVFKFVDSISRAKYGGYVSRLMQDRALCKGDSDIFPKSIAECCEAAIAYARAARSPHEEQISVIYNTLKKKGKTKPRNGSSRSSDNDPSCGSDEGQTSSRRSGKKTVVCWECHEVGHVKKDCPMDKDVEDGVDEELGEETESESEPDEEPEEKPKEKPRRRKGHQYFAVNVADVQGFSEWTVILDSGANVSSVYNPDLLTDVRVNSSQEPISGIEGGEIVPEWEGDLVKLGMTVKYDKRFAVNIVAFGSLREVANSINYCHVQDQFKVYVGRNCFVFKKYNGVYVCNLKTEEQDLDPVLETGVDSGVREAYDLEPEPQIEQETGECVVVSVEQESNDDDEDTVLEPEDEQSVCCSSGATDAMTADILTTTSKGADLFEVDEVSSQRDEEKAECFRLRVAKLMYLAKRVRPELLQAVIYLTATSELSDEAGLEQAGEKFKFLYGKLLNFD